MSESLSRDQARHLALGAQGFGACRTAAPGCDEAASNGALLRTVRRLGALQIDSVNALVRAHYLPLYSRLGHYDRAQLDALHQGPPSRRRLFEYWSHEASLVPVEDFPLYRFRMARARQGGGGLWKHLRRFACEHPDYLEAALAEIERRGALSAAELSGSGRGSGAWWGRSPGKMALEYLFWSGQVLIAQRRGNFERVYDLPERVVGRRRVEAPPPAVDEAQRGLVERAARALGVASVRDVARYFRLDARETRRRLDELEEAGRLIPVAVEGWRDPAWRHPRAHPAARVAQATALLAPFDPLMWDRDRAARLFDFHYRLELYTPAHQRRYGYYVLPFLLAGAMVARVDLRADRPGRCLRAIAAHPEPGVDPAQVAQPLCIELARLARFLGLESVRVEGAGTLDRRLAREVAGRACPAAEGPGR